MTVETFWVSLGLVGAVLAGFGGRFAEAPWWKGAVLAIVAVAIGFGVPTLVPTISPWFFIPIVLVAGIVIGGALRMNGVQIGWSIAGLAGSMLTVGFVSTIVTIAQTGVAVR